MKLLGKTQRFGLLIIIIGAFIPSILYPFTSVSISANLTKLAFAMKGASYETTLRDREIVIVKGKWEQGGGVYGAGTGFYVGRLTLPYSYVMAFGILLFFIGIGIVALYKNQRGSDPSN